MTQTQETSPSTPPRRPVSLELDSPELAATYDRVSTRQFNHGTLLIASLAPRPGERVLDVGCGTGRLGEYVAQLVEPNGEVIGLDPLPLRVEIAARKHPRLRASVGRAEDLSAFTDASFDVAYLNSVFHWVSDKTRALAELRRVLKPGGRLGVNSADADRPHQSALLVRDALLEEGLDGASGESSLATNYRVNAAQLALLLQESGFADVRVETHTFVDDVAGVDDLIAWSSSSSFGNFLSGLDPAQRARARKRLGQKLEALRSRGGIRLERYLVFATAKRP